MLGRLASTLRDFGDVLNGLVLGNHTSKESKSTKGAPPSAALSSPEVKESNPADKKNDKSTLTILDSIFPDALIPVICEYANETTLNHETKRVAETKHLISSSTPNTVFNHMVGAHATRIALNLLWHLDVEQTLAFAKANPACLRSNVVVEVEDSHGQLVRGTVLQILLSAGDRNPREMKQGERDWGLVERLRPCFETMPEEFNNQYQAWSASCEEETKKTHAPFDEGMDTLLEKIIKEDETTLKTVLFDDLLKLPMAEEFKEALKPKRVAEGGFIFHFPRMVLRLIHLLNTKKEALGGYGSLKYDLFATIVYSALLARLPRCDLEVVSAENKEDEFNGGIAGVVDGKCEPRQIDYKKGLPVDLKGVGDRFILAYWGQKLRLDGPWRVPPSYALGDGARGGVFTKLWQAKNNSPGLCNTREITHRANA